MLDFIQDLGHGIYAIDTAFHREHFDAAYLMVEQGRAAFVDTGTRYGVPRLLDALGALGLSPGAVDYVIPTHVHLDHAGGVGQLMQALPQAQLLVHPRGLRHMLDPGALWQGALAVYGEAEMKRSYGELLPVPPERAHASVAGPEGMTVHLAGRPLWLLDTPGHARHHHCVWDERSRGWFTGDTFGLSYREFDSARGPWLFPTSTPVQFEPDALAESVRQMLARRPQAMYLTHFSRIGRDEQDVARLGANLLELVDQMVSLSLQIHANGWTPAARQTALEDALRELLLDRASRHGSALSRQQMADLLALDIVLNAQGLAVWLDKRGA
ncbi:MAG: MBL fold metallo-hydrolase [Burkholderiaceae bacterium]|nr:MBL fold metallo-hydrolase [Roseateles sp.]MBV8470613.1 MBL fold metallo-hydrolase [Burkholderiaceae bacterium]